MSFQGAPDSPEASTAETQASEQHNYIQPQRRIRNRGRSRDRAFVYLRNRGFVILISATLMNVARSNQYLRQSFCQYTIASHRQRQRLNTAQWLSAEKQWTCF